METIMAVLTPKSGMLHKRQGKKEWNIQNFGLKWINSLKIQIQKTIKSTAKS